MVTLKIFLRKYKVYANVSDFKKNLRKNLTYELTQKLCWR